MNTNKSTIVYLRVSTTEQETDSQEHQVLEYCRVRGWTDPLSRPAALALFVNISVAIFTTKIPILLGHGYLGFSLMKLKSYGFLSMAHEARTDFAMWFGLLFLLLAGPGRWSLDALRRRINSAA